MDLEYVWPRGKLFMTLHWFSIGGVGDKRELNKYLTINRRKILYCNIYGL
jgi:hypothetical protein